MSTVHFVCRSEYELPFGHRKKDFDAASLLDWFQQHWVSEDADSDEIEEWCEGLVGGVYAFNYIAEAMQEFGSAPSTDQDLARFLASITDYPEGYLSYTDGYIQAWTNDDEIEIMWYLFTDSFASTHAERTAWLLNPDGWLPKEAGGGGFAPAVDTHRILGSSSEVGTVWCVMLSALDGMTISEMTGAWKVPGLRLPDFPRWIVSVLPPLEDSSVSGKKKSAWPAEFRLLRAAFLASDDWSEALTKIVPPGSRLDLLPRVVDEMPSRKGKSPFLCGDAQETSMDLKALGSKCSGPAVGGLTELRLSPHLVQVRMVSPPYSKYYPKEQVSSWHFFDDKWASAHPRLSSALIYHGVMREGS